MDLRNDILPRDAEACRELASYLEAQARSLRDHARGLEAAEIFDWRKTLRPWRAGKMARALVCNGMTEASAIALTARRLKVEVPTVGAQLRAQTKAAHKRALQRRDREARRLAKSGHSLQQIANHMGLSKSRVAQILGPGASPRD